eukprot:1030782-Rhodomonas_salina.1
MVGCFMYQGVYNPAFVGRAEDLLERDITVLNSGIGYDVSSELNQVLENLSISELGVPIERDTVIRSINFEDGFTHSQVDQQYMTNLPLMILIPPFVSMEYYDDVLVVLENGIRMIPLPDPEPGQRPLNLEQTQHQEMLELQQDVNDEEDSEAATESSPSDDEGESDAPPELI